MAADWASYQPITFAPPDHVNRVMAGVSAGEIGSIDGDDLRRRVQVSHDHYKALGTTVLNKW